MRMGVREARTIVVVVALRSTVLRSPGLGDQARQLWKHSLLAASATQEITAELPPWETSGFLAGLLHDLGNLVVLAFVSELPAWQEDGCGHRAEGRGASDVRRDACFTRGDGSCLMGISRNFLRCDHVASRLGGGL